MDRSQQDDLEVAGVAAAMFAGAAASGGLAGLDDARTFALAAEASDDPYVQSAMLATAFADRTVAAADALDAADGERRAASLERRRSAVAAASSLTREEASRLLLDRDLGDPSGWLRAKERFYYG